MCTMTKMDKALVAQRDIYCYKLLRRYLWGGAYRFLSPIMSCEYIPDTVMISGHEEGGFVTKRLDVVPEGMWFDISHGFHSYISLEAINFVPESSACSGIVLAKCRIPRGSYYWKGTLAGFGRRTYDEYCSDRIEFVAWSEPDRIEWKRPNVSKSHMTKLRFIHPEIYGENTTRKMTSILNGLDIEEAAGRISGYSLCSSYMRGNERVHLFRSAEYGSIELRTTQGKVYGVTLF